MRKISPAGLVVPVLALALGAWGCSDGGGGTGTAGTGGGTAGRGGTGGGAAGTGGGAAGTGGGAAGTGGSAAGTGGSAAGTGGATGGSTAGTGGATGGSTAGTGGATGGSTAGTGGATGGSTAGAGGATGGSTAGTGGGTGGSAGGTGGAPPVGTPAPNPPITGSATRPQLTAGTDYTILKYFEKAGIIPGSGLTTDNWDPTAGVGDVATFTPMFTVAATGGTHTTVQAALTAAVGVGGTARVYIKVEPGTYRETICHRMNTPPITLYGTDAATTIIVNNGYAGKVYTDPPPSDPPWNTCANSTPPTLGTGTYGTSGSATVAIYARDFQAKNLTFSNDYVEAGTSNIQAVALMTQQDKQIYENVRVLGNQDSLYVKTGNVDTVQRVYFKNCYVEGDTDFIFGRATFVLDNCEIKYLGARRGATSGGYIVSPSTDFRNAYGLLIINSMFTSDGVPNAGTVFLGRAWDEGQASGGATYPLPGNATGNTGGYPNGQAVIRNSVLGAHISVAAPWTNASTTSRPYSSVPTTNAAGAAIPANRLWELTNTGAGAATP